MVPTKERNHSAILLRYDSDGLLFDCGEGTQRQIKIAGHRLPEVTRIFLTHWHGDHVLGLPGLIQSLGASEYAKTLEIYGPPSTKDRMEHMKKAFVLDNGAMIGLKITDIKPGTILDTKQYTVEAYELEHGIQTFGYRFVEKDKRKIRVAYVNKLGIPEGPQLGELQRGKAIEWKGNKVSPEDATYIVPGKKISFISDTLLCENCYRIAQDTDLLICESAFASTHEGKAELRKHMTGRQAGLIASKAGVKKLILTHFSTRYKDTDEIEEDARTVFDNVMCAYDFLKVRL